MGKSAPKSPDPMKVSKADAAASKDVASWNASLNRVNQVSPFGAINWSKTGTDPTTGADTWQQSTTLSPELQGLLDSQIGSQQGISDAISGAIGRLPGEFNPNIDVGDIRQRSMESQMALMQPQFDRANREFEGRMSDRGLPVGSAIWNDQLGELARARDTSILGAARQADQDANAEYQRQFSNELTKHNLPLQTLSTLMGSSSPVQSPSFSPFATSQAQAPDVSGNVWRDYESRMNQYNQNQSNVMSGILGLGKLGLGLF